MKRQEANFKIANYLDKMEIGQLILKPVTTPFSQMFRTISVIYPEQRAGQLICNYLCPDYRSERPSRYTKQIMETLFPGNPDPFFEESVVTLERLTIKHE